MSKIIASPSRYVQGKGALLELGKHASKLGKHFLVLVSETGKKRVEAQVEQSMQGVDATLTYEFFNGESSKTEISRITKIVKEIGADVIIGIGGGKIHDTAKAVAYYAVTPVIIVPTIASTDAPCSALSVIYTDAGVFEEYLFLPSSPNMVLVDIDVIINAPVRLLVAGMGDALATLFEARACVRTEAINCVGGTATLAAQTLAQLCYETLLADGYNAKLAVENKVCTKAVENIIEANTYLSGIGFESGGLAGAHAFHNALTVIEETHELYHGEKVAYGTLVQLALENDRDELEKAMVFCAEVGLPVTLSGLGIEETSKERLMQVATLACAESDTMGNMPFAVTPDDVYAAMLVVNAIGEEMFGHSCGCGDDCSCHEH